MVVCLTWLRVRVQQDRIGRASADRTKNVRQALLLDEGVCACVQTNGEGIATGESSTHINQARWAERREAPPPMPTEAPEAPAGSRPVSTAAPIFRSLGAPAGPNPMVSYTNALRINGI